MQREPDNVIEIFLARYVLTLANIWHDADRSLIPENLAINKYFDKAEFIKLLDDSWRKSGNELVLDDTGDQIIAILYPSVHRRHRRIKKGLLGVSASNTAMMMLADAVCREIYTDFLSTFSINGGGEGADPEEVDFLISELRSCPPLDTPTAYIYLDNLITDTEAPMPLGGNVRLVAKRLSPGADGALVSLSNRASAIAGLFFRMIDFAELEWERDTSADFAKRASLKLAKALESVLEMESSENESPALSEFLEKTGFLAEIPAVSTPESESKIKARLNYCVRELAEVTGIDLSNCKTPGEAAVIALKKGKALEEVSSLIATALEDCISILEIGDGQD